MPYSVSADSIHEQNIVSNGTFEIGTSHSGKYVYAKDADSEVLPDAWEFSDARSGITRTDDTAWHPKNVTAADDSQWAVFLQEYTYGDGGYIEQDVEFPQGGTYEMTFMWTARSSSASVLSVEILLDGVSITNITRDASNLPYNVYEKITFPFDITEGGEKRLKILVKEGSGAFCIDQIGIYPAPTFEVSLPATAMLGDNGRAEPLPVVTDIKTGETLLLGTDYNISYADNDAFGTGTVKVEGIAPHSGVFSLQFEIPVVYFAVPDTEVGEVQSGFTWNTAMTYTNALKKIAEDGGELWLKAGHYLLVAKPDDFTSENEVYIRGGFKGDEKSLSERPAGLMTVIDGQDAVQTLKVDYQNTPPLFHIERMSFRRSSAKGLSLTASGTADTRIFIVDCDFSNNTLFGSDEANNGLGLYLDPGDVSCVISNCTFQGNVSTGTGTKYGYGAYFTGYTGGRVFLDGCCFLTNGYAGTATAIASVGAAFCAKTKAVTVRGCKFIGNRSGVNGNGGIAVFDYQCPKGHAVTNCVFVGNEMVKGGGTLATRSGVIVVRYYGAGQKNQLVDVANCTFAYNIASWHSSAACAATAHTGTLRFINSIFFGNVAKSGYSGGSDISVTSANGYIAVEHSLFGGQGDDFIDQEDIDDGWVTLGEGVIYGDPDFVSRTSDFLALATDGTSIPKSSAPAFKEQFLPSLLSLNVHLRGHCGYKDEVTGVHQTYAGKSIAIDAGAPESDYSQEPEYNGKRINLGAYGNTPYASMSMYPGAVIRLR